MPPKQFTIYGKASKRSRPSRPAVASAWSTTEMSPVAPRSGLPEEGTKEYPNVAESGTGGIDDAKFPSTEVAAALPSNTPTRARRSLGRPANADSGPHPQSDIQITPSSGKKPVPTPSIAFALVPFEDEEELTELSDSPKKPSPKPKTGRKVKQKQPATKRAVAQSSGEEGEGGEPTKTKKRPLARGKKQASQKAGTSSSTSLQTPAPAPKGKRARPAPIIECPDSALESEPESQEEEEDEETPKKGKRRQSVAAKRKATSKDLNGSSKKPTKRPKPGLPASSPYDEDVDMPSSPRPKHKPNKGTPKKSKASAGKGRGKKDVKDDQNGDWGAFFFTSSQNAPEEQDHDTLMRLIENPFVSDQEDGKELEAESEDEDVLSFKPTSRPEALFDPCFVFARYPKAGSWYVAEFLDFHPAQNEVDQRAGKDYCEVRDFNGQLHTKIKLVDIVAKNDERIATIKLGKYDFEDDGKHKFTSDADVRPPSPPPQPEPSPIADSSLPTPFSTQQPLSPDDYSDLPSAEQLRLIRPHLQSVLDESYPLAQWRLDTFHTRDRESLNAQGNSGDYSEDEISGVLLPELRRWALRRERWRDVEQRPQEPPRPTGSQRYEALSPSDRDLFIQLVLLPEAIVEICIRSHAPGVLVEELRETEAEAENGGGADENDDIYSMVSSVRDTDDEDEEQDLGQNEGAPRTDEAVSAVADESRDRVEQELAVGQGESNEQKEAGETREPGELNQLLEEGDHKEGPDEQREAGEDQEPVEQKQVVDEVVSNEGQPAKQIEADGKGENHPEAGAAMKSTATTANPPLQDMPQPSSVLTPASLPRPSPPPRAIAPPAEDPALLYKAARTHLLELSKNDTMKRWSMGETILKRAREKMRERLGLAPEHLSKEELKEWEAERTERTETFGAARSMRKVRSGNISYKDS
ncbi:hypothetical protein IAR50_005164 [Cryptococcus sp. DSM 104548]